MIYSKIVALALIVSLLCIGGPLLAQKSITQKAKIAQLKKEKLKKLKTVILQAVKNRGSKTIAQAIKTAIGSQNIDNVAADLTKELITDKSIGKANVVEVVSAVTAQAPSQAEAITAVAIKLAPRQAVKIATAVVKIAPKQAIKITKIAIKALPKQVAKVTAAIAKVVPNQAGEITKAAIDAAPASQMQAISKSTESMVAAAEEEQIVAEVIQEEISAMQQQPDTSEISVQILAEKKDHQHDKIPAKDRTCLIWHNDVCIKEQVSQ